MAVGHTFCVLIMVSTAWGQRPGFAGSRPIGFPELYDRTTEANDLGNRFGEANDTNSVKLPVEANGDKRLVEYLLTLPEDKQPFWLLNWQALEEQRKNPQTFDQRPNQFIQPVRLDSIRTTAKPSGQPSSNQGAISGGAISSGPVTVSSIPITNTVTNKPISNITPAVKPSNGAASPNPNGSQNSNNNIVYTFTSGPKVTFTGTFPPRFGGEVESTANKKPGAKNPNSNTGSFNSTFQTSNFQANGPLPMQNINGAPLNGNFQSNFQSSSLQNSGVMSNTTSGTQMIAPGVTAHTTNYSTSWFNSYAFANSYNYSTKYGSNGQPITTVVSSNGQPIPVSNSNAQPIPLPQFPQFGSNGQPITNVESSNGQPFPVPSSNNGRPNPLAIPSNNVQQTPVVITHKVVLESEANMPARRPTGNSNSGFAAVAAGAKRTLHQIPGFSAVASVSNGPGPNPVLQIPIIGQLAKRHQQRKQETESYEDTNGDYDYVLTITE